MSTIKYLFPEISRPGEYVAFLNYYVTTAEGPAYIYIGCDGFSEFAFNICVESDESPASIIKAVYLLTENKDFVRHMDKGFTLVFDRFEDLSENIENVIKPVNGKVLFNKKLHKKIVASLVSSLSRFSKKSPKR